MKNLKIVIGEEVYTSKKFDHETTCDECSMRDNCGEFDTCLLVLGAENSHNEIMVYAFVKEQ